MKANPTLKKTVFRDTFFYFLATFMVCITAVIFIAVDSYTLLKSQAAEESLKTVTKAVNHEREEVAHLARIYANWDQTYQHLVSNPDKAWAQENIGRDLKESFNVDLAAVVKSSGEPIFVFQDGHERVGDQQKAFQAILAAPTEVLFRYNQQLYLMSAAPIQGSASHYLIVGKVLGPTVWQEMGKTYLINNLQFSEQVDENTLKLPLKVGGAVVGYLTWEPSSRAMLLLQRLIPSTILILLLLGVLAVLITRHVVAAAKGHEQLLQELSQSKDAAESASVAKSKFLATMSHELRTPMNGLLGMIGLLKDSELTKTQQSQLDTLQKSSAALMHIIEEVLEFSQLESKQVTLTLVPVDVRKLVEDVHSFLMPVALQKKLTFAVSVNENVPQQIKAYLLQLRQILLYLTDNAIKFTSTGSVKIEVEATPLEDQHCMLTFKVIDTGIGIAEDIKENLFKDFFQGDSSLARQFEGAGLGLAIAKQLTHLMGGTLGADSTLGKGSTFWVRVGVKTLF